jgi:hypothetical protein
MLCLMIRWLAVAHGHAFHLAVTLDWRLHILQIILDLKFHNTVDN